MNKKLTKMIVKSSLDMLEDAAWEIERYLEDMEEPDKTEKFVLEDSLFQINEVIKNIKSNLTAL